MSTSTTSAPRERAAATPSNTTAAGSASAACLTISQPTRSAHWLSCSTAAARNVSPATMSGVFPISLRRQAILPIVVVLPVPLTPTMRITVGWLRDVDALQLGVVRPQQLGDHVGQLVLERLPGLDLLGGAALLELVDDLDGAVDAHVGGDQHLLGLLVEPAVDADVHGALEPVDDGAAGFAEVAAQAAEEAPAFLRFFFQHRRRHFGLRRCP